MTMSSAPFVAPYDQWGLVQFPTQAGPLFSSRFGGWLKQANPDADQALAVILDWLACFLCNDQQVTKLWKPIAGAGGGLAAVRTVWVHNPNKVVFSDAHTPSLYLWRDSARQEWDADDWLREYTVVKGLWIFPEAMQEMHRIRSSFTHVMGKAIGLGIERGRTPSWVQPGDPDKTAFYTGPQGNPQGSLFYTYAGFDEFTLRSWKDGQLLVKGSTRAPEYADYPALELTFDMVEKVSFGVERDPPFSPNTGMDDTVQTADPTAIATWAASTAYGPIAIVQPTTPNGFFYVGAFLNTKSGVTEPAWPTTPGATIADGTQTWTCVGLIDGVSVSGPLEAT